jgi:CRP-like cAMP-binding protein
MGPPDLADSTFDIPSFLLQLPLFRGLEQEPIERLSLSAEERCHARGRTIFRAGEWPTGLFVVVSGVVKEGCFSPDGREKVLELLESGQILGDQFLFPDASYSYDAVALTEVRLLHIDKDVILDLADSHPGFVGQLLKQLSARVFGYLRDIEFLTAERYVQRVASYLVSRHNDARTGRNDFFLPAAKQILASRLGMTPESLSRNLRDLAESGLIAIMDRRIEVLDLDRLREYEI